MVASRSSVVKRPHGIPGTNKNKVLREQRKVISLNGPIQPRTSLTIEQQQPNFAQTTVASHDETPLAEDMTQPVTRSISTSKQEPVSSIITLVSRKETPQASEQEEADEAYQDEPDTDSLPESESDEDYEEEEQLPVYDQRTRQPANTRTIPTTERASYQNENAQRLTNSYVVPRKTYTQQQPPMPTSRTRETGGNYPNATASRVVPAGQIDQSRSNYRPPDRNKTRVLPQQHHSHPVLFTGLGMILLLIAWFATTTGASWITTHLIDPATYGPMHGSVVEGVFGGGDSQAHPSQLIAMNNAGQVEIFKMTASNPKKTQVFVGPNLIALGYSDPKEAEVALRVQGNKVVVTIYDSTFTLPLYRSRKTYTLISDGEGNFKPQTSGMTVQ